MVYALLIVLSFCYCMLVLMICRPHVSALHLIDKDNDVDVYNEDHDYLHINEETLPQSSHSNSNYSLHVIVKIVLFNLQNSFVN